MSKNMEYAKKLAKLIQAETINEPNAKSNKKFDDFYALLKKTFPALAKTTK